MIFVHVISASGILVLYTHVVYIFILRCFVVGHIRKLSVIYYLPPMFTPGFSVTLLQYVTFSDYGQNRHTSFLTIAQIDLHYIVTL